MYDKQEIRVSYIISTRNRADFLDRTLDNVREFITSEDELIVMDGSSTDCTPEVIEKHRDIVTVFKSEPDFGEAHGYNKGILQSKGRYIKPLADDDYFYPEAMHHAISVMEEHPELDAILCGGEAYVFDPTTGESRLHVYLWLPPPRRLVADVTHIFDYVSCGLGLVLSRRAVSRIGLFDTTARAVDTDYMSRLIACQANFQYLNIKLFRHVAYPHSGQNNGPEVRRDAIRALLHNKAWVQMMDRRAYSPEAVGEVLGLSVLPGGHSLMELISHADGLRTSRVPYLGFLNLLFRGINLGRRVLNGIRILGRLVTPATAPSVPGAPRNLEPHWDGDLR